MSLSLRALQRSFGAQSVRGSQLRSIGGPAVISAVRYSHSVTPVKLSFDVVQPPNDGKTVSDQCLVVCHGLFGSKQNWRSLSKMFAQQLKMPIYTLDLRNHGHSPHAIPHTYSAMATDIHAFMEEQGLKSGVNLLGHSMGGKAVMAFALDERYNSPLRSLTVVDMAPGKGKISPEFAGYTEGMQKVQAAKVKTKSEADKILQDYEPTLPTRQFLLTNSMTAPATDTTPAHLTFRIPLQTLGEAIPSIGDFPFCPPAVEGPEVHPRTLEMAGNVDKAPMASWDGPTLFLKGAKSKYINKYNIPIARAFFPAMKLVELDAGHWVHAEKPKETVELVRDFVKAITN